MKSVLKTIKIIFLTAMITMIIVAAIRVLLFASFVIPTSSMAPTLMPGDFILVNKLVPGPRMDWPFDRMLKGADDRRLKGYRSIKQRDVLVFNAPYYNSEELKMNMDLYYVKRCVGIPGDSVGPIYIPGKGYEVLLDSINIHHYKKLVEYETGRKAVETERYVFRQNYYYVVGDNPGRSKDSRHWGLVPEEHIVGRAVCVWKSVNPEIKKFRWNRFFKMID
ncbi:MAG TPA: signal peptidase I [Sphingobacteriaceae bacterium]|nr:signal peptidase I [Sphingobacteriaceae bacterium]